MMEHFRSRFPPRYLGKKQDMPAFFSSGCHTLHPDRLHPRALLIFLNRGLSRRRKSTMRDRLLP
jgi:hypothetical protein